MNGAATVVRRTTGRISGWYRERRRRTRILLIALPLLILVGLGWWGARDMALRAADHLTITITRISADDGGPAGSLVWRHTFGQKQATQAQDLLNNYTTAVGPFSPMRGQVLVPGGNWRYHLAFTWHGTLIETADVRLDAAPESYAISSLGIPDLDLHWTDGTSLLATITPDQGISIPLPPGYRYSVSAR